MKAIILENFPKEINRLIIQNLSLRKLLDLCEVSSLLKTVIRDTIWDHLIVKIKTDKHREKMCGYIKFVIDNYKFTRLDFSGSSITNKHIKRLKNAEHLNNFKILEINLSNCINITKNSFKYLTDCDIVYISEQLGIENRIKDDDLKHFEKCTKIGLDSCSLITSKGLGYMKNCKELNLFSQYLIMMSINCGQIIKQSYIFDNQLASLTNLHTIDITGHQYVTDKDLEFLSKINKINLSQCQLITDNGIGFLTSCEDLNLSECPKIIGKNIDKLQKLHTLVLDRCYYFLDNNIKLFENMTNLTNLSLRSCSITNTYISSLKNIHELNLSYCSRIFDDDLVHLSDIHVLTLIGSFSITNKGMDHLEKCRKIILNTKHPHITLERTNIEYCEVNICDFF